MPGAAAPVARSAPQSAPASKPGTASPAVPFPIASLKRARQAFDTGNLTVGQSVSAIEIPAAGGFLRYIEMVVTGQTTANAATVVFQADAPGNALSFIEFLPPSGDPPIVPHTGYQLMLWNKYGSFSSEAPWCDPRRDPGSGPITATITNGWQAVAGAVANGGSFAMTLRLPFEIDGGSGFCSITNSAANKSYLLNLTVNTSAQIYSTAPTTGPTVRVIGWMYYWDEPASNTRQGTQQTPGPLGLGSFSQLRLDQPPITAGDKYIKVNNAGPVLRMLGIVLRTSAGARLANTSVDIPATWDFVFNTRDRWLISDAQLRSDMAESFGYGLAYAGTNLAPTFPITDGPMGEENGVRFFPYFMESNANVSGGGPRSQYQVTADATLTQVRGISFGATVATMEILTNLVRPVSAAALYPSNRIS
jgi:hypothetical protein